MGVDEEKMMATIDAIVDRSRDGVSLADLGFSDVGLDAGFEDCGSREVGGRPAFHGPDGHVLVDKHKFPSGLGSLVEYGHKHGLTVSWYGNACACSSENAYNDSTSPTISQAIAGTVADTVKYKFDGLKLDSCSQFNNMTRWADELNKTGHKVLLENCHQVRALALSISFDFVAPLSDMLLFSRNCPPGRVSARAGDARAGLQRGGPRTLRLSLSCVPHL
jgi:hypothetical protein